jgi:hypothetical protein
MAFNIPSYRLGEQQSRGAAPSLQIDAPPAAFGAAGAQHLLQAGETLRRAGDDLWKAAERGTPTKPRIGPIDTGGPSRPSGQGALEPDERTVANETRVEQLVNDFIAGRQHTLHNADDAFFRQRGDGAIRAAPEVDRMLRQMREAALEQAANDDQRQLLARRLDAQMRDAGDVIGRHVAAQSLEWQRDTAAARQALIRNAFELEADDDDKLVGLAEAYATAARELARIDGAPDGGAATVAEARSSIWRGAIDRRLSIGQGPQALALFGRVQSQLAEADRNALAPLLRNAAVDRAADQWIARESAAPGVPLAERAEADAQLSPLEKAVVRIRLDAQESTAASARVARVKGLDDRLGAAARDFATTPSAYKVGSLAAIADAYAAAGASEQAAVLHRVASQEPLLRPFAQLAVARQQAAIDSLPEEARPAAEAIRRQQEEAFARDPFAAGISLYADVGGPLPIDDVASRTEQARTIAERRGFAVAPFTTDEIGSQRDAILARYTTLADDMKAVLRPLLWPQPALAVRETASDIADDDPALHADSAQVAQATEAGRTPAGDAEPRLQEYRMFPLMGAEERPGDTAPEDTGARGSAPATEPDPGSPEYRAADAEARRIVAKQSATPRKAFMPPEPPPPAAGAAFAAAGSRAVDVAKAAGSRVASVGGAVAGTVAGAVAGAIPMIVIPMNKQGDVYPIGNDLRLSAPVSQRSVIVERRVDDGWFGSGIGAKWQAVPVDAEWASDPDGRRVIAIDAEGLQRMLGPDAAEAALRSGGIVMAREPFDDETPEDQEERRDKGRKTKEDRREPPLAGAGHGQPPTIRSDPPPEEREPERRKLTLEVPLQPSDAAAPSTEKPEQSSRDQADHEEAKRREIRETAEYIGSGHANEEHRIARQEYPGIDQRQFIDLIERVMSKPTVYRKLPNTGREAYWDEQSKLLVIKNPMVADRGTAFKRPDGPRYIRRMRDE